MKQSLSPAYVVGLLLVPTWALALELPLELYGEANVSRDLVEEDENVWTSNVSKLGIKGEYAVSTDLSVIYQVEQGIDLVHGGKQVDTLLSTRNTFIGVSGAFGKFMVGTHDTPLKKTQGKVDLFNNQAGDIKALVPGEVRARDSYVWHSPRFAEAFTIQAMYVPADSDFDASQSLAIFWARDSFGINLAIDSKMRKNDREVTRTKVYDAMRGSVEYKPGTWRFGLLLEIAEQRNTARPVRETAYIVSAGKSIEKLTFKMQMGWSDIIVPDARQSSLGVDFAVRPDFILYAQASNHDNGIARQYTVSLGARFKF